MTKLVSGFGWGKELRFLRAFLVGLIVFLSVSAETYAQAAWLNGYCYRKEIRIDHTRVDGGSNHVDFPVLFDISDGELKSVSHQGGHVDSENGWDLVFTSVDGTSILKHEIENYDPASGHFVAWVRVPTLLVSENTILYLYFGNPVHPADPSDPEVWSDYISVYHLEDDASDAAGNNNGSAIGTDEENSGIVGKGKAFQAADATDRIEIGNIDIAGAAMTVSAWVNPASFSMPDARIVSKASGTNPEDHFWMLGTYVGDQLLMHLKLNGSTKTLQPQVSVLSTGSWQYLTAVYNGISEKLYYNGSELGSNLNLAGNIDTDGSVGVAIGNQPISAHPNGGTKPFDGSIDEVRIAGLSRSKAWLTTEYNNLSAPLSFYTMGGLDTCPLSADAGADDQICGSLSYSLNAVESTGSGVWSYVSGPDSSPVFGNASSPTSSVTVTTYGTYEFRWTETNGSCSDADEVSITFLKKPIGQAGIGDQTICTGGAIQPITLSTSNGMDDQTSFAWTRDNLVSITGLASSGTGNISGSAFNATPSSQDLIFTIVPTSTDGCVGDTFYSNLRVNPEAAVDQVADQVYCHAENTAEIVFSTDRSPGTTTYNWTNSNPAIGLEASGSGNIRSFEARNPSVAPDSAVITVVPTYTHSGLSCSGPSMRFKIFVNPTAQVDKPQDKTVCNGSKVVVGFTSPNQGGEVLYNWVNSSPGIGIAGSGTGHLDFTAINTGSSFVKAIITVTPTFRFKGKDCSGPPKDFTLYINPTADMDQPNDTVICNGETLAEIVFSSDRTGGTTSYTWTNDSPSIGLPASGSGNIPEFVAENSGDAPIEANIEVVPHYDFGGVSCSGLARNFKIRVNPTVRMNQPADQVICHQKPHKVEFSSPSIGGSVTYTWVNSNTSIGLPASGSGAIDFNAVNAGNAPDSASITVTPHFELGGKTCAGEAREFSIFVNPQAQVNDVVPQLLCNGESSTLVSFSTNRILGSTSYSWTNNTPGIGLEASGIGDLPSFTAVNAGNTPVVATIVVTPHYSYKGLSCDGPPKQFSFTVNPTAQVNDVDDQMVCPGDSTTPVEFTTDRTMGTSTFTWTNDTPAIGLPASGSGELPAFVAVNSGTAPLIATITVTPHFEFAAKACDGPAKTFRFIVNPTAQVFEPPDQLLCDGEMTDQVTFTTDRTGGTTSYRWMNTNPAVGLPASGNGNVPSFEAVNNGLGVELATITVVPVFTNSGYSCEGPAQTYDYLVNPVPDIEVNVRDTICDEDDINFAVMNPHLSAMGEWKYRLEISYNGLTGLLPSDSVYTELNLHDNLTNSDTVWQEATYHFSPFIEPSDSGDICTSLNDTTIYVRVNPTPAIRVIAVDSVLCSGAVANINIHNPNQFVWGSWEYNLVIDPDPAIDLAYDSIVGIDSTVIFRQLVNTDTVLHKVAFRFSPTKSVKDGLYCAGGEDTTIVIWVNPVPEIRSRISETTICDGESISLEVWNPNVLVRGDWKYKLMILPDEGISGVTTDIREFRSDTIFNFNLGNQAAVGRSARFRLIPFITDSDGDDCMNGDTIDYMVHVNPRPDIHVSVTDTILCSNSYASFTVSNPNIQINGTWQYLLETFADDSITGAHPGGIVYEGDELSFTDFLVNNDTAVHKVIYRFTPSIGGVITCGAVSDTTITIWVNPRPRIIVQPNDTLFCNHGVVDFSILNGLGELPPDFEQKFIVKALYDPDVVSVYERPVVVSDTLLLPGYVRDSLVNHSLEAREVNYIFEPRIFDNRDSGNKLNCEPTETPDPITIWVNPTPRIRIQDFGETMLCDSTFISIYVDDLLTQNVKGQPYWNLEISYDAGAITGFDLSGRESANADEDVTDYLLNNTDTIQPISFRFRARIKDTRPGFQGRWCGNGTDTTLTLLLNPSPRLAYQFLLNEDSLCYNDGFMLKTDPEVYTTHPVYYRLLVDNPDGVNDVIVPPDSLRTSLPLDQSAIVNTGLAVGTVNYHFKPFISTLNCPAKDTTVIIRVNPEPRISLEKDVVPWAVCHDQGFVIPIRDTLESTTGLMQYDLKTEGYSPANVTGIQADGFQNVDSLKQQSVLNQGNLIEELRYLITPVIADARGPGEHCRAAAADTVFVKVAPELKAGMSPRRWIGDWTVQCFGYENGELNSEVSGGYYDAAYRFLWGTDGGTTESLVPGDSSQTGLGAGIYYFEVTDTIGCVAYDSIVLEAPPELLVTDTTIVEATCFSESSEDGSIDITFEGGEPGYSFVWAGPWRNYYTEDLVNVAGSEFPYTLTLRDTNNCEFKASYFVGSAREIVITNNPKDYHGFGVSCFGNNDGYFDITVQGDFPDFDLTLKNHRTGNIINWGPVNYDAVTNRYTDIVGPLDAGDYTLWVEDGENCTSAVEYDTITQPELMTIRKLNAPYHDTVDISCFGKDDGIINIEVSGGRTNTHPNDVSYQWTSSVNDPDLVNGRPDQSNLGPGVYELIVTDIQGCDDTASFSLYEPPALHLPVDSLYMLNGWQISCFGDSDGCIEGHATGGLPSYTYLWQSSAMVLDDPTARVQSGLSAGRYDLRVTDSIGCIFDTSFVLNEPNPLGIDPVIPEINGFEVACFGDLSGQIDLNPLGGADSTLNTYLWETSNGAGLVPGDEDQSGLAAGSYQVKITDINRCEKVFHLELESPEAIHIDSLVADSSFCVGSSSGMIHLAVSGGVPGYSYLWSNGSGDEDLTGLGPGMYRVHIIDDNACELRDSIEVFEADRFQVLSSVSSDYNGAQISCAGASDGIISLDPQGGTAPYSFYWNTGAAGRELTGVSAGSYTAIVEDDRGCKDTVSIAIDDPLPVAMVFSATDPLCWGDSSGQISLLVSGGTALELDDYTVLLNGALAGPYISGLPAGEYLVKVSDLNNCSVDSATELFYPDPLKLSFTTSEAYCKDKADGAMSLDVSGGTYPYHIRWSRGLEDNETDFDGIYWGKYVARVKDANLCVSIDSVEVAYTHSSCLVIPTAFSPNGDGYNDTWVIEGLELYPGVDLWIYDRWGTLVFFSSNAGEEHWDGSFEGRNLPIDSYHYVINLNNGDDLEMGNVTIVR